MTGKAKDFFQTFAAGRMSRRELMEGAGKLGIAGATANFLYHGAVTQAIGTTPATMSIGSCSCVVRVL